MPNWKSKKSLSPIVSALFLMGIMITAIAATVALIYPYLQRIDEQETLGTISTSFSNLDNTLQQLMEQGGGATSSFPLNMKNAALFADNTSTMQLTFTYSSTSFSASGMVPFTRLTAFIPIQSNVLPSGQKVYGKGTQDQNFFALNSSTSGKVPWAILNTTRPAGENYANTTLAYRPIFYTSFSESTLTIQIVFVKFRFTNLFSGSSNPSFIITYDGFLANQTQMFDGSQFFPAGGTLSVILTTQLNDGGPAFTEVPFKYAASSFFLKTDVRIHQFTISF